MFKIRERLEHVSRQRKGGHVGEKVVIHRVYKRQDPGTCVGMIPINSLTVLSL